MQVSNIVGRTELLSAVFFLLSFLVYSRSVCHGRSTSQQHSWLGLCLSVCLTVFSMLCKEQGVTVLGVVWVYDLVVHCQLDLVDGLQFLSLLLKHLLDYCKFTGLRKRKR